MPDATGPTQPAGLPPAPPRVFGPFELVERLGAGGGGEVWKALDSRIGRHVALKLLHGGEPEEIARFVREARTAARLVHASIATVYEAGDIDGRHFIAMQYIDGVTLRRADRRRAVDYVRDAARAVAFAHDHGFVHRDLKPDNIMLADRIIVLDFGLARAVHDASGVTLSGAILGTPAYMSPEQARGEPADVRSDVYGLGATLYDLLGGRPPFREAGPYETVRAVIEKDPVPLRRLAPAVDPDVETVVMKCLEKDPARRYATASDLADDLDRLVRGEAVTARPASMVRLLQEGASRRKAVLLAVAAVVVATSVALGLFAWRASQAHAARDAALRQLRQTTDSCLQALLDQRRAGNAEGLARYAKEGEDACTKAIAALPDLAEPHARLARILDAARRPDRAAEETDRALALDPDHGPALVLRATFASRRFADRVHEVVLALHARSGGGAAGAALKRIDWAEGIVADPEAQRLRAGIEADAARLEAKPDDVAPGELALVRAFVAWARTELELACTRLEQAAAAGVIEAFHGLARIAEGQLRFADADAWLTKAIEQDAGFAALFLRRAENRAAWAQLKLRTASDVRDLGASSVADFTAALRLDPSNDDARLGRAMARTLASFDEPAYRASLEDTKAARPRAAETRARVQAAWAEGLGDRDEARPVLEESIQGLRAFDSPGARISLVQALLAAAALDVKAGRDPVPRWREAASVAEAAIRANPYEALLWVLKGRAVFEEARHVQRTAGGTAELFERALECFREAARVGPENVDAQIRSAQTRVMIAWERRGVRDPREEYERALADLDAAARTSPGLAAIAVERANVRYAAAIVRIQERGEAAALLREALADADDAVKSDAGSPTARQSRANVRALLSWITDDAALFAEALKDFDEWERRAPSSPEPGEFRGRARMSWAAKVRGAGQRTLVEEAIADFGKAIERGPGNPQAWLNRAGARAELASATGAWQACIEDYTKAIDLSPVRLDAWTGRARARLNAWTGAEGAEAAALLKGAAEDASRVLERNAADVMARLVRGWARYRSGDFRGARADFEVLPGTITDEATRNALEECRRKSRE